MAGEIVWFARDVIDALHDRLLAEHGGSPGVRDAALLESALARPQNLAAYGEPDLCDLAASYAGGIVRNHPFMDGNKRTAFMVSYVFLARNGKYLKAPEDEVVQNMTGLAVGDIDETAFAGWLRANIEAGE